MGTESEPDRREAPLQSLASTPKIDSNSLRDMFGNEAAELIEEYVSSRNQTVPELIHEAVFSELRMRDPVQ